VPESYGIQLNYTAGSLDTNDQVAFRRLLFRTSKGKVLCYFSNTSFQLIDHENKFGNSRIVYVLVYEHGELMKKKVDAIC
jgi:hypothetical protein